MKKYYAVLFNRGLETTQPSPNFDNSTSHVFEKTMDEISSVDGKSVHVLYVKQPSFSLTIEFPSQRFGVGCSENMLHIKHGMPMVENLNLDALIVQLTYTYRQ